jgi:hypothetical protein
MATMQTDVLATKPLTSTGDFLDQNNNAIQRARVKTIYAVNGGSAGSVVIRQGGASGKVLITVNTAANTTAGYTIIPLPGEGILCESNLHGTVTNTTSMTLIYG